MNESELKFCQDKANVLMEDYKTLIAASKNYLYPWKFLPLGWYPETKGWPSKRKAFFGLLMPFMTFDAIDDNKAGIKPYHINIFSLMIWGCYWIILISFCLAVVSFIVNYPPQSVPQDDKVSFWAWALFFIMIVFALLTYIQTSWYLFHKKTSSPHRLFIIGCNLLLACIFYDTIQDYLFQFQSVQQQIFIFLFVAASWIPLFLTLSLILLILSKFVLQGFFTIVIYLLRAYSTNYATFINKLIFGDINKSDEVLKLISLPISEITYLKELAQRNLENTEKKTTPTAIFLAGLSVVFAFTPFSDWVKQFFEISSEFVKTIINDGGITAIITYFSISFIIVIIPISIFAVFREYINLLGNLYIQGILVEACTIAEFIKIEFEKKLIKKDRVRSPWQYIFDWFFGNK